MKSRFALKFNLFDIIVIAFSIFCAVAAIVYTNITVRNNGTKIVTIQYKNRVIEEINFNDLRETITITLDRESYPDLEGEFFNIEIDPDKGVRVSDVDCPNEYCKKQGWVNNIGYPIVCVPNGVVICITSPSVDSPAVVG